MQAVKDTALAGGKRLRPYLFLLSYQAYGGKIDEKILQASLSWELIHVSLLIHDDIIDRDYHRHGQPNVSGIYQHHYRKQLKNHDNDLTHYADSAAILGGDILLTEAQFMVLQSQLPQEQISKFFEYLRHVYFEVANGELIDVESTFSTIGHIDAEIVSRYKTSSYTFIGPIVSGAALAGASKDQLLILKNLSELCGYAFQLRDDILGVFGNEETTGKSIVTDIEEGKRTKLLLSAYTKTDKAGRELLDSLGKIVLNDADIENIRQIIITTGAKQEVIEIIHECSKQAKELLKTLSITDEYRSVYESLIDMLTGREK